MNALNHLIQALNVGQKSIDIVRVMSCISIFAHGKIISFYEGRVCSGCSTDTHW